MDEKARKKELKKRIKKQKVDRLRSLRVVESLSFEGINQKSPVEINEGYIVTDRETYDIFASFVFKSVSKRPISELKICLVCYQDKQNIPYLNIDFTYSQSELTFGIIGKGKSNLKLRESNKRASIDESELFGSAVYIPIPETYFKRMEVKLVSVTYSNGITEVLDTIVGGKVKRFSELDNASKIVYTRINVYENAEYQYPAVVIPQSGENAWLCCCGTKNSNSMAACEHCGREKQWQMQNITDEKIQQTKQEMIADPGERVLHDKSAFKQVSHRETEDEIRKKIEKYEEVMRNVAEMERRRERRNAMIIPKILIYIIVIMLLLFIVQIIAGNNIFSKVSLRLLFRIATEARFF